MKNSIFFRTFVMVATIVLITFILLGSLLMNSVFDLATQQKSLILENECNRAAGVIQALNKNYSRALEVVVINSLILNAENTDTNVIVTDFEGNITFCTDTNLINTYHKSVSEDIVAEVLKNEHYSVMGNLGGVYNSTVYTMAKPVFSEDNSNLYGMVFVSSPTNYLQLITTGFFKSMLSIMLIVLFLSFIITYFLTRKMIKPLKDMSLVATEYAKGNLDKRIEIKTHDELGELSMSLNNMAYSLSQLENMRSSFIANVSHELKTPMTTITGFIDGILDGTIPPEKEKYYLKIVSDETKRLSRMVKSLLDVARFETGEVKLNKTKVDLLSIIGTVLVGFEQKMNEKNIYAEVHFAENDIFVNADYDMIFQVVYNLLENAIKFVNENGVISVRVEVQQKKAVCFIKNTGQGIPVEDINMIYERFYKTDKSRGMDKTGVGLGLHIVKSIILAHEETINVESVQNEYTEFSFTLSLWDKNS